MKHYGITLIILLYGFMMQSCAQERNQSAKPTSTPNNKTMKFEINKSEEEWKKQLGESEYYVLREKGTERPFTGKFLMNKEEGVYKCGACGNELFTSDMKFDSHCGWPSFDKEIAGGKIVQVQDNSHGMSRTEIMCAKCGGHLGHIFNDGPTETGMRYCVNSLSLSFEPEKKDESKTAAVQRDKIQSITLGGGCFWCIEAVFQQLKGVKNVKSGYCGGSAQEANYKTVCTGNTKHVEVVQIEYDSSEISLAEILKVFFTVHDPTTLNRQGADVGTQYHSVIFYNTEEQKTTAQQIINELNKKSVYNSPIVTAVEPTHEFFEAEDYHQNYYNQNTSQPYCKMVIQPKLEKFEKVFSDIIKK